MDFYKTQRWKNKRERILRRDGYLCRECKRFGKMVQATEVHHIKHADEYPELIWVDDNLISLCKGCHNKKHPEKGTASRRARY